MEYLLKGLKMFKKLYVSLMILRDVGKVAHSYCKDDSFYGNHIFTDRIIDKISDFLDDMIEICYLGSKELPPFPKGYYAQCAALCPDFTEDEEKLFADLYEIVESILNEINDIGEKCSVGQQNLLGGIAEEMTRMKGLLWRRLLSKTTEKQDG